MDRARYNGFVLEAAPYRRANDTWTLHVLIERHHSDWVDVSEYWGFNTSPTREGAFQNCFVLGRRIIDGQVAGCVAP